MLRSIKKVSLLLIICNCSDEIGCGLATKASRVIDDSDNDSTQPIPNQTNTKPQDSTMSVNTNSYSVNEYSEDMFSCGQKIEGS